MEKISTPKITQQEIDLIKEAQAGSKSAFNRIFYMYKSFVENLLYRYIKDKDEARDIANIVFVKVHDKLSLFREYSSFGGWLRILTKNTAIDYLRTIKDGELYVDSNDYRLQSDGSYDGGEADLVDQLTFNNILDTLPRMTENKRKVLTMYYVDNHTISEISKQIGMPTGSIKSILFRFRKQVSKNFKFN